MSHVYITSNGSNVGIDGGRLIIKQKNDMVRSIPRETIEGINIFGDSVINCKCTKYLLEKGIPVCYFSSKGKYYGRLESNNNWNIVLQKKQFDIFADLEYRMELSKRIINAKISNQRIILSRYVKNNDSRLDRNIALLKRYLEDVYSCKSIEEIMGVEGISARIYFDSISTIINNEFKFKGRNKRPPKDPFNALLSMGYTVILNEIVSKLEVIGLNPYYGFMHSLRNNHPALASDLMEEWRAVIVDSTVLSLIQGNEINIDEFYKNEDTEAVIISKEGLKKFINKLEKKLNNEVKYLKYLQNPCMYREAINWQAKKLAQSINDKDPSVYEPILIR